MFTPKTPTFIFQNSYGRDIECAAGENLWQYPFYQT